MSALDETLAFTTQIAREAGALLAGGAFRGHTADRKASSVDLVTEYDRRSEALLLERIGARFPGDQILAEEGGAVGGPAKRRWIIDPLDGTTNFAHGLPFFCVSIGLEIDGALAVGVIDAPALGWTFGAREGGGATLERGGQRSVLHVSETRTLAGALLATGFPYDNATSPRNNFAQFSAIYPQTQGVRRIGAAALDLALVAAGWLDGFWEMKLKPWDVAAGALLVREAGGRVSGFAGEGFAVGGGDVVASNGHLHDQLVDALAEVGDGRHRR